jgi:hypothetical protein
MGYMNEHAICRLALRETLKDVNVVGGRFISATVEAQTSPLRAGLAGDYVVEVLDSLLGVGSRAPIGKTGGHFRRMTYEVDACCRWSARASAIGKHTDKYPVAK